MDGHLTSQDFAALASGELPKERARAVLSHFLRGCKVCQTEAAALWHPGKPAAPVAEQDYDAAFDRVLAKVERELLLRQVSLAA